VFLDIEKAHDTVERKLLWEKFKKVGNNIAAMYLHILKQLFDINIIRLIGIGQISKLSGLEKDFVRDPN
jgi:hypothetical protein